MKYLLMLLLLLPLTANAFFSIAYDGEFYDSVIKRTPDGGYENVAPKKVTGQAVAVTEYISLVGAGPVTDGVGEDGVRHCWFMVDFNLGIQAMISSKPMIPEDFVELPGWIDFLILVHKEAKSAGGVKALSERCAAEKPLPIKHIKMEVYPYE